MKRAFPADIAKAAGVSPSAVRKLADSGVIEMKRDWNGWRWTDNPLKAVRTVRRLLDSGGLASQDSDASGTK